MAAFFRLSVSGRESSPTACDLHYKSTWGNRMRTLVDCTVLVVEDEGLIAWDIEETLRDAGCERVHLASSVDRAKIAVHQYAPTVVVLDVNLRYEKSFALADMLAIMRIPFFFLTSQNVQALPPEHRSRALISKPHTGSELIKKILELANARESLDVMVQATIAAEAEASVDPAIIASVKTDQSEQ
jgi:DNA-binding response OmpR family regulator